MSYLFGNHIVGFPTRWLISCSSWSEEKKKDFISVDIVKKLFQNLQESHLRIPEKQVCFITIVILTSGVLDWCIF